MPYHSDSLQSKNLGRGGQLFHSDLASHQLPYCLSARPNSNREERMRCPTLAVSTDPFWPSVYCILIWRSLPTDTVGDCGLIWTACGTTTEIVARTPLEIVAWYGLHAVLQRAPFVAKAVRLRSSTVSATLHGKSDIPSWRLSFPVSLIYFFPWLYCTASVCSVSLTLIIWLIYFDTNLTNRKLK